jgi:DNA ligase-1
MIITRPMKGEELELNEESARTYNQFPVYGTPKFDGIRAVQGDNRTLSSSFKDIPNLHIQEQMKVLPPGVDGELILDNTTFSNISSAVMSSDGKPNFVFCAFDYVSTSLNEPYLERIKKLEALSLPTFCRKVIPTKINSFEELVAYEQLCLDQGYEGIMIRSPDGPYKCGKATVKQGWLLKVKRFKDSECKIIGFEEQQENTNEKTVDELGKSKRSKHQAGMVGKGTLGKFLVEEIGDTHWKGKTFAIGTGDGLTAELRQQIWDNRDSYVGKIIVYKYQMHGTKDLPRLPIWKGFRDPRDMS